jgi:ATP-dependent Lon protease
VAKERTIKKDQESADAPADGTKKKRSRKGKNSSKGEEAETKGSGVDQQQAQPVVVTATNLAEYVGQPKFTSDRFYDVTPPGNASLLICWPPAISSYLQ